ncbi:hypothetical protein D515_00619 [Grimontia indica]|uniref:Uncharacterized protein n=1 Tax=Grimontia indica TaxID=1056512 RepID=R1IHW7_9GAMM|nr:hypothetical protein D515_00619 [Grimontia indica]
MANTASSQRLFKLEIPVVHLRRECLVSCLDLQKTDVIFLPVTT